MATVQLKNLEKRYDNDTVAVQGISFAASDGEFIVLVGPSGCGKSTTLRMVAGLEEITAGDLLIDDVRMNDVEPKDRDIAMVFQNYALYPHMTVFENLAFPLKMRKVPKAQIAEQVTEAARLLSIEGHLKKKPKQLSGGERQRVAVGRAIVRRPKVFLFDEPLSNLDAALRTQMRAELKRLQRRLAATMLYVTHDQVEAMTMGDKIAVMNRGLLEQFGTPSEIYGRPATTFVARFLGAPPMNLLPGRIEQSGNSAQFITSTNGQEQRIPLPAATPTTEAYLGFRPESVRIGEATNDATFCGKLVLTEPIGSVTHYYIDCPEATGGTLVASISSNEAQTTAQHTTAAVTSTLSFTVPSTAVHLFDKATGKRIESL